MLKFSGSVIWRLGTRATLRQYSSAGATVVKTDKLDVDGSLSNKNAQSADHDKDTKSGLVAAAFATLNTPETDEPKRPSPKSVKQSRTQQMDIQIVKATDINGLLAVAEHPVVSRRHALKMVSILSDWSSSNKVKITDFEKDPRFLKLCRILARTSTTQAMSSLTMAEDLSTVLGITGDDEAARLISNLTLPQMVKVMRALHQKGRRSTPLLRALSYNITRQADTIDLKKSADLLYSMATLNFPDPLLMDRICKDVIECLPSNKDKPAVVNSIIVSLGLLKYRHEPALTAITDWIQTHMQGCRAGDIASAVITLATVDFTPPNSEKLFKAAQSLKEEEMAKSSAWLDLVFALLTLDKAQPHQLLSTIQPEFIDKLLSLGEILIPSRRKLMAIDAYLHLTAPSSPRLPSDISVGVPLVYTKEKTLYVHCIMDTFRASCPRTHAEFAIDSKCHPVPLEKAANDKSVFRIAVLGLDYHDLTRKTAVPLGVYQLYTRMLQLKGFKVLQIPYTEFNPRDKLVTRVQYIEKRLKEIISDKSAA
ncbi:FAST kinase domain-containing protein 4 [Leguminivora glycinivorella]|uniref:FAST kinase domain-containing protein 4 n=1 Tax=Leguminivora glycinivorella TaxID=1035111 RepID=UPI00200EB71A|nr:FAST kinase domain-containing protein 4 [Leguminivora glycinivorella]